MQDHPVYQHRQVALLNLVLLLVPLFAILIGLPHVMLQRGEVALAHTLLQFWPIVVLVIGAAASFLCSLEVTVTHDTLSLRFGPGVYRKSWSLAGIRQASTVRTNLAAGFGIHRWQGAWVYNVAGFDAVRVSFLDGTSIIIGSDDAIQLAHVLERARPRT